MPSTVTLHEISSNLPAPVAYAVVTPGQGGTTDSLCSTLRRGRHGRFPFRSASGVSTGRGPVSAEFLHRLLWDLDLLHEYRPGARANHGGPLKNRVGGASRPRPPTPPYVL
jgi:hypothetical protein